MSILSLMVNNCDDIHMSHQVLVPFRVGRYEDEILCDIIPMQASHLLLGRPQEFDKNASHEGGRTNKYSFVHNDRKISLVLLSIK